MGLIDTQANDSHAHHRDEIEPRRLEPLTERGTTVEMAILSMMVVGALLTALSASDSASAVSSGRSIAVAVEDAHGV